VGPISGLAVPCACFVPPCFVSPFNENLGKQGPRRHSIIGIGEWSETEVRGLSTEDRLLDGNHLMRAEDLHTEAQNCRRLAGEALKPIAREALIELARDYERQAERLERQSEGRISD
jgi:hypothetical protein